MYTFRIKQMLKRVITFVCMSGFLLLTFIIPYGTKNMDVGTGTFIFWNIAGYLLICIATLFFVHVDDSKSPFIRNMEGFYSFLYAMSFVVMTFGILYFGSRQMTSIAWTILRISLCFLIASLLFDNTVNSIWKRNRRKNHEDQ